MAGFLRQPREYTFLPALRPDDSPSDLNREWYGNSETQDLLAILDACLHNCYDVQRAQGIFQALRDRADRNNLLEIPVYNSFLGAYLEMATVREAANASFWFGEFWSLFEAISHGDEGVAPNASTLALALVALHRVPSEIEPYIQTTYNDIVAKIAELRIDVATVITSQAFTDSEEVTAILELLSRSAIQLRLPHIVEALGQAEHIGRTDLLDTIPEAIPVYKNVVKKSASGDQVTQEIPFNIDNVRQHLARMNFARRVLPNDVAARQKMLEESVYDVAQARLTHEKENMDGLGITTGHDSKVRSWMWDWHGKLAAKLDIEIQKVLLSEQTGLRTNLRKHGLTSPIGHYLTLVSPARLSLITIIEIINMGANPGANGLEEGIKTTRLLVHIGRAIETEYKAQMCRKNNINVPSLKHTTPEPGYFSRLGYTNLLERRIMAARHMSDNEGWTAPWIQTTRVQIGGFLVDALMDVAKVVRSATDKDGNQIKQEQPAFYHSYEYTRGFKLGTVRLNDMLSEALQSDKPALIHPRHLPMLVPPQPWVGPETGGYFYNRTSAMRYKESLEQASYMRRASSLGNLELIYAGMDVLGSTPWVINRKVFDVVLQVWNSGEELGKLPPAVFAQPEPTLPENASMRQKMDHVLKQRTWTQEKGNNHSKRCNVNYKIEIARSFLGDRFYQPHNLDFRGRAYPVPPHLNHMGDDLSRGLMKFADAKPLGQRGLRWLKIHLANLYGYDKAPFDGRVKFVDDNLEHIFDSATKPLEGSGWWKHADDPWQCLATCFELHDALTSPDPYAFMSSQPVHQDGTCNGLQHYAALGGDSRGAAQVNLSAADRPSDVYTYVANMVEQVIEQDVEKGVAPAQILQNRVSRKMVKQTVMTTVYGVTYVGAREQIERQIRAMDHFADENHWEMSSYLARTVLNCIGDLFSGATAIQNWLTTCARIISHAIPEQRLTEALKEYNDSNKRTKTFLPLDSLRKEQLTSVVWTTPLGLPVVQPYRKTKKRQVLTKLQTVFITDPHAMHEVNMAKQASAFPPNFVHSLDATHMMLSALECQTQKLTFAAVHDSYWTHASTIDELSIIIRDTFIALHSSDVLGKLRHEFAERYEGYKVPLVHLRKRSLVRALAETGVEIRWEGAELVLNGKKPSIMVMQTTAEDRKAMVAELAMELELDVEDDAESALLGLEEEDSEGEPLDEKKPKKGKKIAGAQKKKLMTIGGDVGKFVSLKDLFPPVPQKGDFRVEAIKASQYFFS